MRRFFASVALFAAFAAAACTDNSPTGTVLSPGGSRPLLNEVPLADQIDAMITDFFPNGLETSTGSRWETVKERHADGDFENAKKHYFSLADWIKKKTSDITLDATNATKYPKITTQTHAATQIVYAMSVWLFVGADQELPELGGDSEFAVVPAGQAATVVTETKRAGVDIEAGSTSEDRVIVVAEDARKHPGHCNGPLVTELCQYPVFYKFESYPHVRLNKVARFAVCHATKGERLPLDYGEGHPNRTEENEEEVHKRLRLAHDKPANPADYTPGSTIVDGIEILPRSAFQKGFTRCAEEIDYARAPVPVEIPGGWRGRAQRALLAVANFAGRLLTPKDLYAIGSGPEHDGAFFSSFNQVDEFSQPDLKPAGITAPGEVVSGEALPVDFSVSNKSRRQLDGEATGTSKETSAAVYLVREQGESTQEQLLCAAEEAETCGFRVGRNVDLNGDGIGDGKFLTLPDEPAQPFSLSLLVPETVDPGNWFVEVRVAVNPGRIGEVIEPNNVLRSGTPILVKKKKAELVVFNDINFFDDFPAQNPNNIRLYTNLVDYTAPGARSDQKGVMIHFGHNSVCCGPSYIQTLINTYNNRGNPVTVVDDPAATITSLPAAIKLLFLVLPNTPYSDAEINVLKQFAGEGGRIVFIGEHGGFYPTQINTVENPLLAKMGAQLTTTGATIDCGYNTLPQSSIREHQITEGLTNVTMGCASKITLGPNDYALVYGLDGASIIAAVASIDVTPLPIGPLASKAPAPLFSASADAPDGEDPVGAKYAKPPAP